MGVMQLPAHRRGIAQRSVCGAPRKHRGMEDLVAPEPQVPRGGVVREHADPGVEGGGDLRPRVEVTFVRTLTRPPIIQRATKPPRM